MSKEEVRDDDILMESKEEKQPQTVKTASIFNKPAPRPAKQTAAAAAATQQQPQHAPLSTEKRAGDANLPWVEKYRPSALDQLLSHADIIATIQSLISKNRLPHLLLYGPPGTGKCFAAGTRLLMMDGSTRPVEHVREGDELMGDDGQPRTVSAGSLARGRARLYRVRPAGEAAEAFTVNGEHILVLRIAQPPSLQAEDDGWAVSWHAVSTDNQLTLRTRRFSTEVAAAAELKLRQQRWTAPEWEVSVLDFLRHSAELREVCRMFQSGPVKFRSPLPGLQVTLSAVLGIAASSQQLDWVAWYLGLSTSRRNSQSQHRRLPAADVAARLADSLRLFGEAVSLVTYRADDVIGSGFGPRLLRAFNVQCSGRVPHALLCDSLRVRRGVLAGLIDGQDSCDVISSGDAVEISSEQREVAESCRLLAGSLGITCNIVTVKSAALASAPLYSFRLSGDLSAVFPLCASPRKQSGCIDSQQQQQSDSRCFRFSLSAESVGDYYGFEVSGANHRFLLSDFTVTHNTSTILAIAKQLFGPRFASHILELNASDDRGIDVVREQIKDFASSRQLFSSGFKLIVLDEADNMTKTAQFALRRVIERYTRGTRFCLICNYVNKIIPALQSRCTKFRFGPLEPQQIERRMREIAEREGVQLRDDGVQAIVKLSEGDMRKVLNVLQATHMSFPVVDAAAVYAVTGNPLPADIMSILHHLLNSPLQEAFAAISGMQTERGLSLTDIITYLHELVMRTGLPEPVLAYVLAQMADAEYRLAGGAGERLQLAGLCGVFVRARQMVHDEEKKEKEKTERGQ